MWQHSKSKILHLVHLSLQTCLSVAGGPGLFTLTGTPIQGGIQGYIGSVSKKKRVTAVCFVRNFALSRRSCSFGVKLCRKAELKVHVFSLFFTLGFWGCESSNC